MKGLDLLKENCILSVLFSKSKKEIIIGVECDAKEDLEKICEKMEE